MSRTILLLAAGAAALALTGCDRHPHPWGKPAAMTAVTRLDCPERQGALTRTSQAADGTACGYASDGAEVTLKLVRLDGGDAQAAMASTEAELRTLIPREHPDASDEAPGRSGVEAKDVDADGHGDVDINVPGVSIQANDNGAKVNVGPVHIDADDNKSSGRVVVNSDHHGEKVQVNADNGGAEIRQQSDRGGLRLTFILTADHGDNGPYKLVGYEARGPAGGPLVVTVVKSKAQKDRNVFDDMKALVKLNVGG